MTHAPPSPGEQVAFLRRLQRLAAEEHLARWRGRNEEHRGVLGERVLS